MSKQSKVIGLAISSVDLANFLIEKYGFPKDTVITRFERPLNQDAWIVNVFSPEFPEHGDLDTIPTSRLPEDWKYVKD